MAQADNVDVSKTVTVASCGSRQIGLKLAPDVLQQSIHYDTSISKPMSTDGDEQFFMQKI